MRSGRPFTSFTTCLPTTSPPNGGKVFPVVELRRTRGTAAGILDGAYLRSFGVMHIPTELWRAMQRFSAGVELALVIEWTRLIKDYSKRQGQLLDEGSIAAAMMWSDPDRGVGFTKRAALARLEEGRPLACVWTGRMLRSADTQQTVRSAVKKWPKRTFGFMAALGRSLIDSCMVDTP